MAGVFVALFFRFLCFRAGQRDLHYFRSFARSVEKQIEQEVKPYKEIDNIGLWMDNLLNIVADQLPNRSVRFGFVEEKNVEGSFRNQDKMNVEEFSDGKLSVIHGVKRQKDVFRSSRSPNFTDLTRRVLDEDRQWKTVLKVVPVDMLARLLDILPGLFIVGGIFGTFIGITSALPMIAQIDLGNLDEATPILNTFVSNIAFAMNTSIAGILCSVVLTILNAMFPLSSVRIEVRNTLARSFEFIWYRIHGQELGYADAKIIDLLERLNRNVAASSTKRLKKAS